MKSVKNNIRWILFFSLFSILWGVTGWSLVSEDLLTSQELEIRKKVKERSFVWGQDDGPLMVQPQLIQPVRKFGTKEEESLGLDHD
jgi:hypothetical protein